MTDAIAQFRAALLDRGLCPAEVVGDGVRHRCRANNGKMDGAYQLYLDGVPAGWMENHSDGMGITKWRASGGHRLTPAERAKIAKAAGERAAKAERDRRRARGVAEFMWAKAKAVKWHPYLKRKRVGAYGIKELDGELLIPVRDTDGKLMSLQRIDRDGGKKFLKGASTKGGFHIIEGSDETVYFVEGYATGATVFQATKATVIVAFDCGNLLTVASCFGLRERYGFSERVAAVDDDWATAGNPGLNAGNVLLSAGVCDRMVVPDFGDLQLRPTKASDFNDLADLKGIREVRRQLT